MLSSAFSISLLLLVIHSYSRSKEQIVSRSSSFLRQRIFNTISHPPLGSIRLAKCVAQNHGKIPKVNQLTQLFADLLSLVQGMLIDPFFDIDAIFNNVRCHAIFRNFKITSLKPELTITIERSFRNKVIISCTCSSPTRKFILNSIPKDRVFYPFSLNLTVDEFLR